MSKTKELKTEIEIGEFKGYPTLIIHELDEDGKRKQYPLITLGTKKCKAIIKHIEEIEHFCE